MKRFMKIGPHFFEKSRRQTCTHTHTHTDTAALSFLYIEACDANVITNNSLLPGADREPLTNLCFNGNKGSKQKTLSSFHCSVNTHGHQPLDNCSPGIRGRYLAPAKHRRPPRPRRTRRSNFRRRPSSRGSSPARSLDLCHIANTVNTQTAVMVNS